jgi:hypothetical protein
MEIGKGAEQFFDERCSAIWRIVIHHNNVQMMSRNLASLLKYTREYNADVFCLIVCGQDNTPDFIHCVS